MTLTRLLHLLRERLIQAMDENDLDLVVDLKITFMTLREALYETENEALIAILNDLEDAAQDSLMGAGWKSDVPSAEAIESALSTAP
jgi:hypothetical protein